AVREAVSLAAHEAAAQKVIDLQARDLPDLLRQLDGRSLRVGERALTLATAGATVERQAPDWRARLLAVLTDPSVALILMMIGIYGLIFELAKPGICPLYPTDAADDRINVNFGGLRVSQSIIC
ncbi:hypothetical protein Q2470_30330, partial [Pseudomonas aeruginosa]|nr:hypothetical protein [Pseudomonas aeruginosa]